METQYYNTGEMTPGDRVIVHWEGSASERAIFIEEVDSDDDGFMTYANVLTIKGSVSLSAADLKDPQLNMTLDTEGNVFTAVL